MLQKLVVLSRNEYLKIFEIEHFQIHVKQNSNQKMNKLRAYFISRYHLSRNYSFFSPLSFSTSQMQADFNFNVSSWPPSWVSSPHGLVSQIFGFLVPSVQYKILQGVLFLVFKKFQKCSILESYIIL